MIVEVLVAVARQAVRRAWCFLFWHRPVDIGCINNATGKRVHQCLRCGQLKDVE